MVNTVAGIARTKVFAILLGTFGIGIVSQLMNFYYFTIIVSSIGIPFGITKYVSEWDNDGSWEDIRLILGQSITLLLLVGFAVITSSLFFAKEISFLLFRDESYFLLIIFLSISIPFTLVSNLFDSFIKGLKRFGNYLKISVIASFLSLLLTLFLVYYFEIFGAVLALTFTAIIYLIAYTIFFKKTKLLKFSEYISFNFKYSTKFKILIKLGFGFLAIGSAELLSQMVIRALIIKNLGVSSNGLYQCIYSISMNYFSILFMSLGIYLMPTLSALKDKESVNLEINNTFRLTLLMMVPLICFIFIFKDYIILLLYSKEFIGSGSLLFFSFLGDYFRAFSQVIGAWLVPDSRFKAWITFSLMYYVMFVLFYFILSALFDIGLRSVVISYFVSNLLLSAANLWYIIKHNKFRFSSINLKIFPLSFFIVLIILIVSDFNTLFGIILFVPGMVLWLKFSVKKDELVRSFALVKNKLKGFKP